MCASVCMHVSIILCACVPLPTSQDIGCGIGGPARVIARSFGATVTGLNICDYQLKRARELNEKAGLSNQVSFVKVSAMDISCQSYCHCI